MSTESALSYAALILSDAELEISSSNLLTLTSGAKIEVDAIWADLYSKALDGKDLTSFFFNFSAAPAAGAAVAGTAGAAAGGAAEEAAAEEKVEEKEESDDDMGFGLFD